MMTIIIWIYDNIILQILLKHQSLETLSFSLATDQARVKESKDGKTKVVITSLVIWSSLDCHHVDRIIIWRLGRLQPTARTSSTPSCWRWRRRTRRSSRRTRSMESSKWWVDMKITKKSFSQVYLPQNHRWVNGNQAWAILRVPSSRRWQTPSRRTSRGCCWGDMLMNSVMINTF